jgi:glycosyltransferase involved in cell wall biosynthesis
MSPVFSICIPAYNAGEFLVEAIESVLNQSFADLEIIVLDNASTDNTALLLSKFEDERLKVFKNLETLDAHENWTLVVSKAQGQWVKLLCADDLLKPTALQQTYDVLFHHPDVMAHVGLRDVIDEFGMVVRKPKPQFADGTILNLDDVIDSVLRSGTNTLGEPVCLTWRRTLSDQVGPFSDKWHYYIDLDYWLRLVKVSAIYYTTDLVGSFRVSSGSWTSSIGFRTINEARTFFSTYEPFSAKSKLFRFRALVCATVRTLARQAFLSIVLRKIHRKKTLSE